MAEIHREGFELNSFQNKIRTQRGLSSTGNKQKETVFCRVRKFIVFTFSSVVKSSFTFYVRVSFICNASTVQNEFFLCRYFKILKGEF